MSLRWTANDLAAYLNRGAGPPAPISEKTWQRTVLQLLAQQDYVLVYHTFDSRHSQSGFPDLIAVHRQPGRKILAIELKRADGQVTAAQQAWLDALAGCTGVVSAIWRPADIERIVHTLRGA